MRLRMKCKELISYKISVKEAGCGPGVSEATILRQGTLSKNTENLRQISEAPDQYWNQLHSGY